MNTTIDPVEREKFSKMAEEWWDPSGKFKALHKFNPKRIEFIRNKIIDHFSIEPNAENPFSNLDILDIGCGGGLLSEPMSRLGGNVSGIDIVEKNINVAKTHSEEQNLEINYKMTTAEELALGKKKFDVILNMEVIEHVSDLNLFIESCEKLLKKNGLLFFATLNRNLLSFGLAIVGAEYILGWLPKGTHNWKKFITPEELKIIFKSSGLNMTDIMGMKYNPIYDSWYLSDDTSVNYLGTAIKS